MTVTANDAQAVLQAKLQAMRPRFVAAVTERLGMLEALRDRLDVEPEDGDAIAALTHGAHKLAGVAGMFGAEDLGDCARDAETALEALMAADEVDEEQYSDALDLVDDLLGEMALIVNEG